jgi:excisionase family DNA binding protein
MQTLTKKRGIKRRPLLPDPKSRPTLSVQEAGRVLGVGQKAAYEAVRRGDIPSIHVGRLIRIPTQKLLVLLGCSHDGQTQGTP